MLARVGCFLVVGLVLVCLCGPGVSAPQPAVKEKADSPEVKKLLKLRRDALKEAVQARRQEFQAGRGALSAIQEALRLLLAAELEVAATQAERLAAHEDFFKVACEIDELCTRMHQAGRLTLADQRIARAQRYEAEIGLRRAGGEPPRGTKPAP